MASASAPSIVVFLGPSMPLEAAKRLLDADYRPPVRRGDLSGLTEGTLVGMIDGVFEQERSVSPLEIRAALARGVRIIAGGSMGALRAAEVPGVDGVGLIYRWYRDGVISRDDEVALVFDQERAIPLSVPLVNIRFAVERLCRPGTLDRTLGDKLIATALALPYEARTYRNVFRHAGIADRESSLDLMAMLEAIDLKRQDAQVVLEALECRAKQALEPRPSTAGRDAGRPDRDILGPASVHRSVEGADEAASAGDILIWESGDRATMSELIDFLRFTGRLERHARDAAARLALGGNGIQVEHEAQSSGAAQVLFNQAARRWGWVSPEEARVTLADVSLPLEVVSECCADESKAINVVRALTRADTNAFRDALRAQLHLDDMALKREVMRLGALRHFSNLGASTATTPAEMAEARQVACKLNGELQFSALRERWASLGAAQTERQDAFITTLARARRAGLELARRMRGTHGRDDAANARGTDATQGPSLSPSPKPPGEPRHSLPADVALEHALRLRDVIGVTRVGMIGELSHVGGVQVAQAARPGNSWSSSYGSGKSFSKPGAIVGSILEETEKWAQEQFNPDERQLRFATFEELEGSVDAVAPDMLDLPFDSVYAPDLPMAWYPCEDLLSAKSVLVPLDVLRMARGKHDICYTQRGARKHLVTNGLGSGFTQAEALLHATCEFVERHALHIAELYLSNPGGLGAHPYRFVDLSTVSDRVDTLVRRLSESGGCVRVLDVTSDVNIPTFLATITRDLKRADGHAAHPNPRTAVEMALLEAAQTISSFAAGGREDLTIHARSLGRHERPRPTHIGDACFWLDPDHAAVPLDSIVGCVSMDIAEELRWCLARVRSAGIERVLALNLSAPAIEPACVVRVMIPGLESNNPFHIGPRARLVLLNDLLPRWR
jgi:ribosomal protein S12 methylthiotransferase accessory factor